MYSELNEKKLTCQNLRDAMKAKFVWKYITLIHCIRKDTMSTTSTLTLEQQISIKWEMENTENSMKPKADYLS